MSWLKEKSEKIPPLKLSYFLPNNWRQFNPFSYGKMKGVILLPVGNAYLFFKYLSHEQIN